MTEINPVIFELLKNRGVCSEADALEFLSDSPKKTYSPFLLKGMEEAVDMIEKHIKKGSRICIYGDYDADGVTSVTLVLTALSRLTDNLSYYIPSRFGEGYGLNKEAVDILKSDGTDLIITVDCGSVSYEEVEYAKQCGMDVVVTDHHSITDKKADCILVNPKQPGCTYPFDGLAGVGVAFKLVQAMTKKEILPRSVLGEVLDLVAIGTIGDIVPLVDENRTLVKFGLKQIRSGAREGLAALIRETGLKIREIKSENVAFVIVPHINAAGRLEDASYGVKLLLKDKKLAGLGISEGAKAPAATEGELVKILMDCNKKRKDIQEETFQRCIADVDEEHLPDILILRQQDAHEGITGIVAGKLKEKFYRPSLILTPVAEDDSLLKGTGRSVPGINLYELLKNGEEFFVKFGGHAGACGFTIEEKNFDAFCKKIKDALAELVAKEPEILGLGSRAEMEIKPRQITMELASEIEKLAPFGAANPQPVFEIKGMTAERPFMMGAARNHMKMNLKSGGTDIQAVLFGKAKEYEDILRDGSRVDVEASLEISEWNGNTRLQLVLSDARKA